jgi:hypothetical protein
MHLKCQNFNISQLQLATQFNKFAFSVDPFGDDRVQTIARVQKEIDKINEVKAKEEEARKKKAAKKS